MKAPPPRIDDRMVPQSEQAELEFLAAVFQGGDRADMDGAISAMPVDVAFVTPDFGTLWAAMVAVHEEGAPKSWAVLEAELKARGKPIHDQWSDMVEVLSAGYGDVPNVVFYSEQVADLHRRRRMIQESDRLREAAFNESIPVRELLGEHMVTIEKLASGGTSENYEDAADSLRELPDQWRQPHQRIETGMHAIDDALEGGLERGAMIALGAYPRIGKTMLALQWAIAAAERGEAVLFVTCEMSIPRLSERIVTHCTGTPSYILRKQCSPEDQQHGVGVAAHRIGRGKLFLTQERDDHRIVSLIRSHARRHKTALVVIDFIQLCTSSRPPENRAREIGDRSKRFKWAAVDSGATVLVLTQLNREGTHRDSGELFEDADMVIRLDVPKAEQLHMKSMSVRFVVEKNKNGPSPILGMVFNKTQMVFTTAVEPGAEGVPA